MAKQRDCPVCGGLIRILYVRPDFMYDINEDGKIERDTNNDLWEGSDPYLKFVCENDILHDIETDSEGNIPDSFTKWVREVSEEFYRNKLYDV